MVKKYLLFMLLLLSHFGIAQVNATYNFDTSNQGWNGDFAFSTTNPCAVGSLRSNIYSWFNQASVVSPLIGISNGMPITLSFEYKAINWSGGSAASANAFNGTVEWSGSPNGPWNSIGTYTNSTSTAVCTSTTFTFTPTSSQFYLKYTNTVTDSNDIYVYIDNVVLSQGVSNCDPISNLSLNLNSYTSVDFSWQQNGNTITSYQYEIRTSGLPGSGTTGLVDSGVTTNLFGSSTVLTPETNYVLYVRKECTGGDLSGWNGLSFLTGYCVPNTLYSGDYTSAFSTSNALQNVNYTASSQPAGSYSNQTSQIIQQAQGLTFDISTTYVGGGNNTRIWIDYNDNFIFEDSELAFFVSATTATQSGIITIPITAPIGNHRMRVRSNWNNLPPACGTTDFGSTVDFTLQVLPAPSCMPPTLPTATNITKNSAVLSWTSDGPLFDIELMLEGQTPTGIPTQTLVTNQYLMNDLLPSTTYTYYVRQNCNNNTSFWVGPMTFTTMCEYPDLINVQVGDLCGYGSAELTASSTSGIIQWFTSTNGVPLHTGNVFNTPNIEEDTTFYLRTGSINAGTVIQVGNGTTVTSEASNPFYYSYSGYKFQYTFTAQELIAAGLSAGPINSLAFDIVAGSTVPRNGFRLYLGHTTQTTATATHVPVADLTLVYTNAALNVTPGITPMNFTNAFVWDGVSNIIVQTVYSNGGSYDYSNSGSVRTHTASPTKTSYFYSDYATVDQFVNATTASGTMYSSTSSNRPNIYLNGVGLCSSPFIPVIVEVDSAPELVLSSTTLETCQGNQTELLSIVTGAESYDSYVWMPAENVSGDAQTGWIFNPQVSTVYTLLASQSDGVCSKTITINVDVTPLGYENLEETYITCANEVLELSILAEEIDINTLPSLNLLNLGFNNAANLGVTLSGNNTTLTHQTTLFTEGSGSIKWYVNTSAAAALEIDQTVDISNSYGLLLEFDHVAMLESQYWAYDYGFLQYSTDNGATWTSFTKNQYIGSASVTSWTPTTEMRFARDSYSDWNGTMDNNKWKQEKFYLPADASMNNIKLRFNVVSDSFYADDSWYIDNVRIQKVSLPEIEWAPITNLFLDQQLTQPYAGESVGTVYFNQENSGNYPYTVTIGNDMIDCETSIQTEVIVPELVFPGLLNNAYCTAVNVEDLEFDAQDGVIYNWFNSSFSQTPLQTIPFTGTYYVQVVAGDCIGSRSPVQINIIGNVNVQVNPNQSFCEGATVASLLATPSNPAATVQWFDSIDATQPLASTIVLQAGTTYYVNQIYYGCESTKLPVNITINQIPDPISVSELTVCSNSTIGSVVIPNNTAPLHWYASMNSTTPLSSQVILTSGTYYISTYAGVCDSQRMPVNVTIVENLAQPQVNVIDICGSGFVSDLNAYVSNAYPAAELRWYNTSTATTALAQDQVLTTGTYYVEQYLTGCTSTRKAVAVRVTSKVAPVINAQVVCEGTKIQDVVLPAVSNVIYNWYSTPTSTQALAVNTVLTTGNYYVRRLQFGCLSDPTMVSVNVLATPTPPTGNLQQVLPEGSLVSDIIMNQPGIVWYNTQEDAQNNTNPLLPNMPLENGHTYYGVLVSSNGCRSVAVAVTINLYLGLNDLDIASLKIYPNPTSDSITVSYSEAIDSVEVYSMLGQKVLDKKGANTEISLDLSHLSSGTYIIKVLVGQNSQLVKVVKK